MRTEALVQGEWMVVPDDKVLQRQDNPTGHSVVCYTPWQGILCFVSAARDLTPCRRATTGQ